MVCAQIVTIDDPSATAVRRLSTGRTTESQRAETPLAELGSSPGTTMLGTMVELFGDTAVTSLLQAVGIRIFSCVVDTNFLVNEVRIAAKMGTVPYMIELARVGSLRLFASTTVRDEVPNTLLDMAYELELGAAGLLQAWALLAPWIFFLDPSSLPRATARLQKLALADPDDVPTGVLVELLDPDLFLTADKALADFGPSPVSAPESLRTVRIAYRDKRTRDAMQAGVGVGGSIMLVAFVEVVGATVKMLRKQIGRLPKPVVVLALLALATAAGLLALRRRETRIATQSQISREPSFAKYVLEEFGGATRAGAKADRLLSSIERPHAPPRTCATHAARVLSRSPGPVSLDWLVMRMYANGYRSRTQHARRSVERRLRAFPRLFVRMRNGRWVLGRILRWERRPWIRDGTRQRSPTSKPAGRHFDRTRNRCRNGSFES